ncbi:DUF2461 domain-containing protein [Flavobacteriaceae bacterium F89]|uniref:DUF2461 domain-containing protein n=1 Tax=Cerina litoralis TaxID=2874477 RepID=A0AAE3EVD1_9FLAO|nr:DUF2461 domain-containing protein [Cerina litoralis]MCG2461215.1 DUF2461 domain-containing protein [Cerina litoralis]
MSDPVIAKNVFTFLKTLEKNNNREWFADHKGEFKDLESDVKLFYKAVMEKLKAHDEIERLKMFRIYRDIRFSKDKTPYKTHFGGSFARAGARLRGGYYLHLQPQESFIAAGFWEPKKEDLHRIRKEFELDATEIRGIINDKKFKKVWGGFHGESLKTAPKGFDREHPNIDLIRRKQFVFTRKYTDKEVMSPDFLRTIDGAFREVRPYFDLMSDILTTNLNGESLL